jgi:hypothetical protein
MDIVKYLISGLSLMFKGQYKLPQPGVLAHACNHIYLGGRDLRYYGQKPGQKIHKTPSQPIKLCLSFQPSRKLKQEDYDPGCPGHKVKPCLKNKQSRLEEWLKW